MSDSDILIKVEHASKKFCRNLKKSLWYGLNDMAAELTGGSRWHDQLRPEEFWAVNDVSFELRRGECIGLIGPNGAGKTTLLKMLYGLIKPDHGRITMTGRVGALIALGAGFNPILTGRENIYVNGSVLGLTKREIEEKIEEIIDFAGIREFIDSPVQSYSSGMQVRLGFSVATAVAPDILLLDEVLAVGDMSFRSKCHNRIGRIRTKAAVVLVSHTMEQIANITDRALVMAKGKLLFFGDSREAIHVYNNANEDQEDEDGAVFCTIEPPFTAAQFEPHHQTVTYGQCLSVSFRYSTAASLHNAKVRFLFYDDREYLFSEWNSEFLDRELHFPAPGGVVSIDMGPIHFKPGTYRGTLAIHQKRSQEHYVMLSKQLTISVVGPAMGYAPYQVASPPQIDEPRRDITLASATQVK